MKVKCLAFAVYGLLSLVLLTWGKGNIIKYALQLQIMQNPESATLDNKVYVGSISSFFSVCARVGVAHVEQKNSSGTCRADKNSKSSGGEVLGDETINTFSQHAPCSQRRQMHAISDETYGRTIKISRKHLSSLQTDPSTDRELSLLVDHDFRRSIARPQLYVPRKTKTETVNTAYSF